MGMLPSYTVEPGASATELKVTDHPPEDMHRAMAAALDRPFITVLTAVQDVHSAQREQWDDGCNVLAVEPGVVVAYERNVTTNTYLQDNGVEVLTVPVAELLVVVGERGLPGGHDVRFAAPVDLVEPAFHVAAVEVADLNVPGAEPVGHQAPSFVTTVGLLISCLAVLLLQDTDQTVQRV